jgi:hypothetical protein
LNTICVNTTIIVIIGITGIQCEALPTIIMDTIMDTIGMNTIGMNTT